MNNIEAIKINHQSIYLNNDNTASCVINTLDLAVEQFQSTFIYQNQEKLNSISQKFEEYSEPEINECIEFVNNNLIDKIKIGICFENLFKSLLLLHGFIIHKIDKNIFTLIGKAQSKRPISLSEILNIKYWEESEVVNRKLEKIKIYTIKGILETTLNYSLLLNKKEYYEIFEIEESLRFLLQNYNSERNKLHLLSSKHLELNRKSYSEFKQMKEYLNKISNKIRNAIEKQLKINFEESNKTITVDRITEK